MAPRVVLVLAAALGFCVAGAHAEEAAPAVAVEGYGIRLTLKPPFKLGRIPPGQKGAPDQFITSHPEGGKLLNLIVIPEISSEKQPTLHRISTPAPGYQVGSDGTIVGLAPNMEDLAAVGTLTTGATTKGWSIVSGTTKKPWPVGTTCGSAPAPQGYAFERQPTK